MSIYEVWEDDSADAPTYWVTRAGDQIGPRVRDKRAVARLIHDHTRGAWRSSPIVDRSTVAPNIDELLRRLDGRAAA